MKFGIVVFPGSNCDRDCYHVVHDLLGQQATYIWHKEKKLPKLDCVILPGGFSYGDYLRCGAIARFSPIMQEVARFAHAGGKVLGICNGFQILIEAGLLPGALMQNTGLKFVCRDVDLKVEQNRSLFSGAYRQGQQVVMPVAHMDGRYEADGEMLERLEGEGQIVFRYDNDNPNGSKNDIAGICNEQGNVLGMMPHPERCAESLLGNSDGIGIFESLIK